MHTVFHSVILFSVTFLDVKESYIVPTVVESARQDEATGE